MTSVSTLALRSTPAPNDTAAPLLTTSEAVRSLRGRSVWAMDLLCSDHLTDQGQLEIPAVTIWNGWALCAPCARKRESIRDEAIRDLQPR